MPSCCLWGKWPHFNKVLQPPQEPCCQINQHKRCHWRMMKNLLKMWQGHHIWVHEFAQCSSFYCCLVLRILKLMYSHYACVYAVSTRWWNNWHPLPNHTCYLCMWRALLVYKWLHLHLIRSLASSIPTWKCCSIKRHWRIM